MRQTYTTKTPADLRMVARDILMTKPKLLALVGPLGAGKTTLTQALGTVLGIHQRVTSPTYVLQQVYRVDGNSTYDTFVHIDCYRIKTDHEVPALDLAHWTMRPKTLVVIEWANLIENHLAGLRPVWVMFTVDGDQHRLKIT